MGHSLFLLMLKLSRLKTKEEVISVFIESMNSLFHYLEISFSDSEEAGKKSEGCCKLETNSNSYGTIVFGEGYKNLSDEEKKHIPNACTFLSVIMERLDYRERLEKADGSPVPPDKNTLQGYSVIERKYKAAFQTSLDGFVMLDSQGKHLEVNDTFTKMTGFPRNEIIGTGIPHLYWPPEEYGRISKKFEQSKQDKINEHELVFMRKNGERFPVIVSPSVIKNEKGEMTNIFASIKDITQWKNAELKLKQNEKKFRELYENVPVALFRFTEEGKFIDINKAMASMFGFDSKEELLNRPAFEFFDNPIDRENIMNALKENREVVNVVVKERKKDGSAIWVKSNYKAFLDEANPTMISYIDGVAIDITESVNSENKLKEHRSRLEERFNRRSKEIEEQSKKLKDSQKALTYLLADVNETRHELENVVRELADVNKELESFSYSVSHDLRAPLRAISGFTEILKEDYEEVFDSEGRRILNVIVSNVDSMTQLIDDLLSFTRIGRKVLDKHPVDTRNVIGTIVSEQTEMAKQKNADIKIGSLPVIYADPSLIKQVFINLISNAIKFTAKSESPEIKISGGQKDGFAEIIIEDNGIGFDNKYCDKIFDVFQRLQSNDEFEGSGVGLSIVKRIVEKHGGKVMADGKPGSGAKFTIQLPEKE